MARPQLSAALLALLASGYAAAEEAPPRRLPPPEPAPTAPRFDSAVAPAEYQPLLGLAYADGSPSGPTPRYEVGAEFDRGLFLRGVDLERDPYAMYIGGRLQLRHTGFARDRPTWTDSAGVTRAIRNRNNLDAERVRLNIQGTAVDPNLTYYFVFDGDSDGDSNVDLLAYIFTYEFHPALQVRLGRWKVASDREWLLSSRFLTLADRSMATEYFRGGFSDGVWLVGELDGGWRYEASLTNGLSTSTRRPANLDDNLAAAATVYCDPLGPYGGPPVDYEWHEDPVVRVGGSFGFDKSDDRSDVGFPLGDDNFLRLSDGSRLSDVGVLAPGVRVTSDRLLKGGLDFGAKWRGWSLFTELFVRSIQSLEADGPIPVTQIDDAGFRADIGVFLVPKRLDLLARVSRVDGDFGASTEYAAGFNYYFGSGKRDGKLADPINKFTFDVTVLDGSPITTSTADLFAGDDGVLFRTQVQLGF